jgi:hypothetical protein
MSITPDNWIGTTTGADWGTAADWSNGNVPDSNNIVTISTPAILTVTYNGDSSTVHSLTVGDDVFDMQGGTLTVLGAASFGGGFEQTGGTLTAGAIKLGGGASELNELLGGAAEGHTAFTVDTSLSLGSYTLGGASALNLFSTTNLTGNITLGDSTGVDATIDNEKSGRLDIGGDFAISEGQGADSARFINAGTLEKSGGSNPSGSIIGVNVTDTGTIVVETGILEFVGPDNSFAGAISGTGALTFGQGGKDAIDHGTTISTAGWTITDSNTVATLNENLKYIGTFTLQNGAVLDLAGSLVTLTLSGIDTFQNNAEIAAPGGAGTLGTTAGSSTSINSFFVGGGITWQNSGTVGEVGTLQLGDTTFNQTSFINEKGGIFEIAADVNINPGSAFDSTFINDTGATLEKTGGGNPSGSGINVDVTDNGAIVVKTGSLFFNGFTNSFAGKISGAGQFALANGESVIDRGTAIATATFGIYNSNTLVTLDTNLSYAGTFNIEIGALVSLDGVVLILSGNDTFNNATIDGAGELVTAADSKTSLTNFTLGGAVNWRNSGTLTEFNTFAIGDTSFDVATFTNEKGGVFNFAAASGITLGAMPNSSFVNNAGGTVEKTSGGDSQIGVPFTNNGSVLVETGAIEFQNLVGGVGRFTIEPGTGLQFDAAVASHSSVVFASHLSGALLLVDSQQFGATIHGFGGTDAIDLFDIQFGSSGPKVLSFRYSAGSTTEGVLTVGDGTHTAHLTFFGTGYKTADFHASGLNNGGTMIVDPPPHATLFAPSR